MSKTEKLALWKYDKNNGLWYKLCGDYYLPGLVLLEEEMQPIGLWGQRHRDYLREYKPAVYNELLITGKLFRYLADIDRQAEKRLQQLAADMAQAQGILEQLKAADQMAWVGRMNNIRSYAEEVVLSELIYGEGLV